MGGFSFSSGGVSMEDFRSDKRGMAREREGEGERTGEDGGARVAGCGWTVRSRHLNLDGGSLILPLGTHNQKFSFLFFPLPDYNLTLSHPDSNPRVRDPRRLGWDSQAEQIFLRPSLASIA